MDQISEKQKRTQRIEKAKVRLADCESAVKACFLLQDYAWTTAQNPFMAWKVYAAPKERKLRMEARARLVRAGEALAKLLKKPAHG